MDAVPRPPATGAKQGRRLRRVAAAIPWLRAMPIGERCEETVPANLSPEYKAAEAGFRAAREPRERLEHLREMLRAIPKHKGTEHLQADIKSRIKQLTEELAGPKKGGARSGPTTVIRREGAAQVALLGPPNVGKSTLHARLTGSHAEVGPYPFTTHWPMPGMLAYEDVNIQLVDLPPVSPDHPVPWIGNTLQSADGALLVVDLLEPDCVDQLEALVAILAERRVELLPRWGAGDAAQAEAEDHDALPDPFAVRLACALVVSKADLLEDVDAELEAFRELTGLAHPALVASGSTGAGCEAIGPWLFEQLGVVRVYTKAPGRPPDMGAPFTVRAGDTVHDVAALVHRDIAERLRYARLWGSGGQHDGQQVGRDHAVRDGDVIEIHV